MIRQVHEERYLRHAREAFRLFRPGEEEKRAAEIAALPQVEWKGHLLRSIRCDADTGRGPHVQHVPESLLWALFDLGYYRCPFHR